MIWESGPWCKELIRIAGRIDKRTTQRRWPETALMALEQDVMIGAYVVRKLIEAETKVPHAVRDQSIDVVMLPAIGRANGTMPDLMNWHHLDRWFDFDAQQKHSLSVRDFCNQVMHSWIFMPLFDEKTRGFSSIAVSSDRDRRHSLYLVSAAALISLFHSVGESDVTKLTMTRDAGGQWVVRDAIQGPEPRT